VPISWSVTLLRAHHHSAWYFGWQRSICFLVPVLATICVQLRCILPWHSFVVYLYIPRLDTSNHHSRPRFLYRDSCSIDFPDSRNPTAGGVVFRGFSPDADQLEAQITRRMCRSLGNWPEGTMVISDDFVFHPVSPFFFGGPFFGVFFSPADSLR